MKKGKLVLLPLFLLDVPSVSVCVCGNGGESFCIRRLDFSLQSCRCMHNIQDLCANHLDLALFHSMLCWKITVIVKFVDQPAAVFREALRNGIQRFGWCNGSCLRHKGYAIKRPKQNDKDPPTKGRGRLVRVGVLKNAIRVRR